MSSGTLTLVFIAHLFNLNDCIVLKKGVYSPLKIHAISNSGYSVSFYWDNHWEAIEPEIIFEDENYYRKVICPK